MTKAEKFDFQFYVTDGPTDGPTDQQSDIYMRLVADKNVLAHQLKFSHKMSKSIMSKDTERSSRTISVSLPLLEASENQLK